MSEVFICKHCGKSFTQSVKFCAECGGQVGAFKEEDIKFICEKCGKEFPEKWNFCHDCAGRIVTMVPYSYPCSKCGREFDENTKFCPECGGQVERCGGIIGEAAESVDEKKSASAAAEFCPGCGNNTLVNGFCTNCGYSVK
jgi:rRNA maturation endonuclease Nob1